MFEKSAGAHLNGKNRMQNKKTSPISDHKMIINSMDDQELAEIYITSDVLKKIEDQCKKYATTDPPLETLGLLLGDRFYWRQTKEKYTQIFNAITTDLDASPARVKFNPIGIKQLINAFDEIKTSGTSCPLCGKKLSGTICNRCIYNGKNYSLDEMKIVGWYHSHPGFGVFMSGTDVITQRRYFPRDFHVALVIDPINGDRGFFKIKNKQCLSVKYKCYEQKGVENANNPHR